jgi:hypothetical protein
MSILGALVATFETFKHESGGEIRELTLGAREFDRLVTELDLHGMTQSEGADPNVRIAMGVIIHRFPRRTPQDVSTKTELPNPPSDPETAS